MIHRKHMLELHSNLAHAVKTCIGLLWACFRVDAVSVLHSLPNFPAELNPWQINGTVFISGLSDVESLNGWNKPRNRILLSCTTEDVCHASSRLSIAKTATRLHMVCVFNVYVINGPQTSARAGTRWTPNRNVFI